MPKVDYLVIGGGIAGVTAARRLRSLDPSAGILILQEEPRLYYLRPGLISVLAGERDLEGITPFPKSWYGEQGIDYRPGKRVVRIDPRDRWVELEDGERLSYGKLLLATGAEPFIPPIPGLEPGKDIFTLRRFADAERIISRTEGAGSAVVIGGGLLGLEAARALTMRGLSVTVVELAPWLLPRQLDRQGGEVLARILDEMGIGLRLGVRCSAAVAKGDSWEILLDDGSTAAGDFILVSTGIVPRVDLAQGAGIALKRGVLVDDFMATDAPDVFACGDVAEWRGIVYGVVPAAREQAEVAAANMVDPGSARYGGTVPAVRLKVAGVNLICAGETQPQGGPLSEARYADPEAGIYRKFVWDRKGRLVGAVVLGERAFGIEELVRKGVQAPPVLEDLLAGTYPPL